MDSADWIKTRGLIAEPAARVVNRLTIVVGDSQPLGYLNADFQVSAEAMGLERISEAALELIQHGIAAEGA
jgi:hypothetical protein